MRSLCILHVCDVGWSRAIERTCSITLKNILIWLINPHGNGLRVFVDLDYLESSSLAHYANFLTMSTYYMQLAQT